MRITVIFTLVFLGAHLINAEFKEPTFYCDENIIQCILNSLRYRIDSQIGIVRKLFEARSDKLMKLIKGNNQQNKYRGEPSRLFEVFR